jgi:rubrerythrin
MELETRRFYERAIHQVSDAGVLKLLGDLAEVERRHYATAESLQETITSAIRPSAFAAAVAISYIRHRYLDTPFLSAAFQVVLGGCWSSSREF